MPGQDSNLLIYVLRYSRGLDKSVRKLLFDLIVVLQTDRKTDYYKKKARAKKTGFNFMIVHFYIRRKLDIIRC